MVGSGPFRFVADERVSGAAGVYARFEEYVPARSGGRVDRRAEDGAFRPGRVARHPGRRRPPPRRCRPARWIGGRTPTSTCCRPCAPTATCRSGAGRDRHHRDPAARTTCIRRSTTRRSGARCWAAVDQTEFMTAVAGDDRTLWRDQVGFFSPGHPDGERRRHGRADRAARLRRRCSAPGRGRLQRRAGGAAGADATTRAARDGAGGGRHDAEGRPQRGRAGHRLGHAAAAPRQQEPAGAGRLEQSSAPPSPASTACSPASDAGLRGNGAGAWFGWPDGAEAGGAARRWFDAPDLAAQQAIWRRRSRRRRSWTCPMCRSACSSNRPRNGARSPTR